MGDGDSPREAAIAVAGGADALVVQGIEAGGHRGCFQDDDAAPAIALLPLLQLLAGAGRPLVATGGIVTGVAVAAALPPAPAPSSWAPPSCSAPRPAPRIPTATRCGAGMPPPG